MNWNEMEWNGLDWNGIDWSVAHYFEINFRNNSSLQNHSNGKTEQIGLFTCIYLYSQDLFYIFPLHKPIQEGAS